MSVAVSQSKGYPKYYDEAVRIIEELAQQPDRTWRKTQRELGERLQIIQPTLSLRLKQLEQCGRVRREVALSHRGKNYEIELVDDSPLDIEELKSSPTTHTHDACPDDRALRPEEMINGAVELGPFEPEMVGAAVVRTIAKLWQKDEENKKLILQYEQSNGAFRSELQSMQNKTARLKRINEELQAKVDELTASNKDLRGRLNQLLIKTHAGSDKRRHPSRTHPAIEMMDSESKKILEVLQTRS